MLRLQLVVVGVAIIACCCANPPSGAASFPKFKPEDTTDFKTDILAAEKTTSEFAGEYNKYISKVNFEKKTRSMYKKRTKPEMIPSTVEIEALFKLYDSDQDNKIDMKDGVMGMMQHLEFFYYDNNLDGKLDEEELMYMYDTPNQKAEYSGSADFVEVYQRLQSHSKLPRDWENSLGKEITAE